MQAIPKVRGALQFKISLARLSLENLYIFCWYVVVAIIDLNPQQGTSLCRDNLHCCTICTCNWDNSWWVLADSFDICT
jgi:hypothetical protein